MHARWLFALPLTLVGCGAWDQPMAATDVSPPRHVELTMEADATQDRLVVHARTAIEAIVPAAGLEPRECTQVRARAASAGTPLDGLVMDYGEQMAVNWDADRGAYHQTGTAEGRDFSWQPVGAWAVGHSGWTFHARDAVQFGARPEVVHVAERPDGSQTVWWEGDYRPDQVRLRVRSPAGVWECGAGEGRAELPWWLAELPHAELALVASQTRRRLMRGGVLLTGHGVLVTRVSLPKIGRLGAPVMHDGPRTGENPAGPRPMFEWQRWATGGWRTRSPA